ncbi:MAG: Asp-tRNA(Asn)/Glu-tRNA(Gln) amidotransferase subunit GatC [Candidatus Micrarchaeia archaeon]
MEDSFDSGTVEHVARLARLELDKEDNQKFVKQINDILAIFGKLDSAEVESAEPAFHPIDAKAKLREDKPRRWEWNPLGNSKHNEGKYIKSPKII